MNSWPVNENEAVNILTDSGFRAFFITTSQT
jgi:hypothetical protein